MLAISSFSCWIKKRHGLENKRQFGQYANHKEYLALKRHHRATNIRRSAGFVLDSSLVVSLPSRKLSIVLGVDIKTNAQRRLRLLIDARPNSRSRSIGIEKRKQTLTHSYSKSWKSTISPRLHRGCTRFLLEPAGSPDNRTQQDLQSGNTPHRILLLRRA